MAERLFNCETGNFLGLLVEEKTKDNYWRHMAEEDCEQCMFPDVWDN